MKHHADREVLSEDQLMEGSEGKAILAGCSYVLKQPLAIPSLLVAFCDQGRPEWTTGGPDHHPLPVSYTAQHSPETEWVCTYAGLF